MKVRTTVGAATAAVLCLAAGACGPDGEGGGTDPEVPAALVTAQAAELP
ncbi:hypothetical protein ACH4LT_30365 [Streptomyces clavifer]